MNKIVFLSVAVLALQALSVAADQSVDDDKARLGGVLDVLDPSRVLSLLQDELENVRNTTADARKAIGTRIQELFKEAQQTVRDNIENLNVAIQDLTTDAGSLVACLGEQQRSPQDVIGQLYGDVQVCIRELTTGVGASMKSLFAVEKAAQNLVDKATTAIQECLQSGILSSVPCLAGVLPDLVLQSNALRVNASEISADLRANLVLGATESVECLGNATSKRVAEASAVLANISECVHEPTSTQDPDADSTTSEQRAETTEATTATTEPATEVATEGANEGANEGATEPTD